MDHFFGIPHFRHDTITVKSLPILPSHQIIKKRVAYLKTLPEACLYSLPLWVMGLSQVHWAST